MSPEGDVPHPQPASKLIDLDELKVADGWMRATAPSGRAAYEGVRGWTPTAGRRASSARARPIRGTRSRGGGRLMVELVLFIIFAITALYGAIAMVWARNPVYSALGLMLTMFSLAVFYVSNAGHFVAVVQVIVYAGAVMTLFLFVIMLIGVDKAEDRAESIPFQRPVTLGSPRPVRSGRAR